MAAERVAPVIRGRRVLEMGCGDGFLTAQMAPLADRIFAFDMNERAIAFAELIVRDPNVAFGTGRAEDLPPWPRTWTTRWTSWLRSR